MKRLTRYMQCLFLLTVVLLVGCGGGRASAVIDYEEPAYNYTPELYAFDLLDSYDTDTAYSSAPLALNPYLYYGLFEVYWSVNSLEDYRVELRVNNYPDLVDSTLVYSDECGVGLWCDQSGSWVCEYGADLTISCDNGDHLADISYHFGQIPEALYLILQVCDINSDYCEYNYYPVTME